MHRLTEESTDAARPSRIRIVMIVLVFAAFFSVPMLFILYGGAGAAIGGLLIVGSVGLLQLPLYFLLRRKMPAVSLGLSRESDETDSAHET